MTMPEDRALLAPKVTVVEGGKKLDTSALDNHDSEMQFLLMASMNARIHKIAKYYEDKRSVGGLMNLDSVATDVRQEIQLPLKGQSLSLRNAGPNPVRVWINRLGDGSRPVAVNQGLDLDYETHELTTLFLQCAVGQTAAVAIAVKY